MDEIVTAGGQPEQTAPNQAADPAQTAPAPESKPAVPSLAETIRQAREAREASARKDTETSSLKQELEAARAELAKARATEDPLADPVGWARARKLSKEDQAALGQALLYDIVPEKAPADFRVKLLEAKMARDAKAREEAAVAERSQAEQAAAQKALRDYETTMVISAKSFKDGSHPESEAWFGEDRDTYARSLMATARNLAEVARKNGQVANLEPGHVAGVLEQEIARRLQARDARRAGASKSADPAAQSGQSNGGGQTASTKGLSSGGPRPKAASEKERIQRAVLAAFPSR